MSFIQLQHNVDIFFVIDKLDMLGYKRSINQYGLFCQERN